MAIETAVITGTTRTTTGTQSYESTGFGTPQAAIIITSLANTTNNPQANIGIGHGLTDGTNSVSFSVFSQDNQANANSSRSASSDPLLIEGNATILVQAAFSAWATDGITLNYTTVDSVAYNITIILIKGCTNVHCDGITLSNGVNDITAPGFKGNLLFAITHADGILDASSHAIISFGAAHNNSSDVVTQGQVAYNTRDNTLVDETDVVTRNDSIAGQLFNGTQTWVGVAQDFDSSGFSINCTSNPSSDGMGYLYLDTGDTDGVSIDIVDAPTATGTWNVEAPAFEPQCVILGLTTGTTTNTIHSSDPMAYGIGAFDATNEYCVGLDADSGATTTDTQSNFGSSKAVQLYEFGGTTHDLMHEATLSSFDSLGYNLSFPTYVNGTAKKWLSIAIKAAAAAAETPGPGFLTLTTGTPKDLLKHREKPTTGNLLLTGIAPTSKVIVRDQVPNANLILTPFTPNERQRIHEPVDFGTLTLTGIAPNTRQTAPAQIVEPVPPGFLTLTAGTPNQLARVHEPIDFGTITLTGIAPTTRQTQREPIPNAQLSLVGFTPTDRVRHYEPVDFGVLTLTGVAPTTRQVAPGQVVEPIPPGSLTLTTTAPVDRLRHFEAIDSATLTLNGIAPQTYTRQHEPVPNALLTLTGITPQTRARIFELPQTHQLTLTGIAPLTRQTGKIIKAVPSSNLRLVSYNPNIPAIAPEVKPSAGGGPKPVKAKIAMIGGQRYKIESYTELRRLLYLHLLAQQQELQEVEAKAPQNRRIVTLKRNITRTENRLARADEEWRRIQEENELILLMFAA